MREHLGEFRLTAMCRVLGVNRSGYYAWAGISGRPRRREDDRLRGLIKHAWLASGTVYGYRRSPENFVRPVNVAAAIVFDV